LIYVFGGRTLKGQGEEYSDMIEKYNIELNIWSEISVRMPNGLCNMFCFTFGSEERIVILGGMKKTMGSE
jgi:N-acetylneuraminic acid mutarotase